MAKRESGARRTSRAGGEDKRGTSEAAKAAGRANLEKGRKKRAAQRARDQADPEYHKRMRTKDRWAALESGELKVEDLEDEELKRVQLKGKDGTFAGRPRKHVPAKWARKFAQEAQRRAVIRFETYGLQAAESLIDLIEDPDVKHGDKIKALGMLLDRALGKSPQTVRVEASEEFSAFMGAAIGAKRDGVGMDDDLVGVTPEEG